jgi:hypothetical protein
MTQYQAQRYPFYKIPRQSSGLRSINSVHRVHLVHSKPWRLLP